MVSDAANIAPWLPWAESFGVGAETMRSFADRKERLLDSIDGAFVVEEILVGHTSGKAIQPANVV